MSGPGPSTIPDEQCDGWLEKVGMLLVTFLRTKAELATATFERRAYGSVLALVLGKIPVTGPKQISVGVQADVDVGISVGVNAVPPPMLKSDKECGTVPALTEEVGVATEPAEPIATASVEVQTHLTGDVVSARPKLSVEAYKKRKRRNEHPTAKSGVNGEVGKKSATPESPLSSAVKLPSVGGGEPLPRRPASETASEAPRSRHSSAATLDGSVSGEWRRPVASGAVPAVDSGESSSPSSRCLYHVEPSFREKFPGVGDPVDPRARSFVPASIELSVSYSSSQNLPAFAHNPAPSRSPSESDSGSEVSGGRDDGSQGEPAADGESVPERGDPGAVASSRMLPEPCDGDGPKTKVQNDPGVLAEDYDCSGAVIPPPPHLGGLVTVHPRGVTPPHSPRAEPRVPSSREVSLSLSPPSSLRDSNPAPAARSQIKSSTCKSPRLWEKFQSLIGGDQGGGSAETDGEGNVGEDVLSAPDHVEDIRSPEDYSSLGGELQDTDSRSGSGHSERGSREVSVEGCQGRPRREDGRPHVYPRHGPTAFVAYDESYEQAVNRSRGDHYDHRRARSGSTDTRHRHGSRSSADRNAERHRPPARQDRHRDRWPRDDFPRRDHSCRMQAKDYEASSDDEDDSGHSVRYPAGYDYQNSRPQYSDSRR